MHLLYGSLYLQYHEKLVERKSKALLPSLICIHIINNLTQTEEVTQRRCSCRNRKWAILRGLCCVFSVSGG